MKSRGRWTCFVVVLSLGGLPVPAQTAQVARIRSVKGAAQAGSVDNTSALTDALVNMPLPAGERLLTGDDGELEIEFADGSVLRMTPNSQAVLDTLDAAGDGGRQTEVALDGGLFYLELRSSDRAAYTITAGDETVVPDQNASFRVKLTDPPAEVAVLSGSVTVTRGDQFNAEVRAGESLRGDPKGGKRYVMTQSIPDESWDNWKRRALTRGFGREQRENLGARQLRGRHGLRLVRPGCAG